ncbi:MAG: hypothetical protein ACOCXQ_00400 [Patescibacteria group bacterium]
MNEGTIIIAGKEHVAKLGTLSGFSSVTLEKLSDMKLVLDRVEHSEDSIAGVVFFTPLPVEDTQEYRRLEIRHIPLLVLGRENNAEKLEQLIEHAVGIKIQL